MEPAPRGRQPTWGGFLPQFLGFHLCQKILDILTVNEQYPYLSQPAASLVDRERQTLAPLVSPKVGGIASNGNDVTWRTFAGGRINSTLRYALSSLEPGWTITPDNFSIRVRDQGLTEPHFKSVIRQLRSPDFWQDESVWQQVRASLPGYRLSKFQPLMPQWVEQEVLFDYLLDRPGTAAWVKDMV